jgi:hypothetical protein
MQRGLYLLFSIKVLFLCEGFNYRVSLCVCLLKAMHLCMYVRR